MERAQEQLQTTPQDMPIVKEHTVPAQWREMEGFPPEGLQDEAGIGKGVSENKSSMWKVQRRGHWLQKWSQVTEI